MKNFFKKLSFVMALALVLTSLAPAGAAQAASAMVMNVSEKILYITENAKNTPDNYDFYIKNKPEDWKSTLDFKWESSDETVATVANGGITQAVGVGVTTISCTITDKETGEEVAFTTCELTVKGIADRVEIINAPEDGIVGIGENVIDLNRAMYDGAGNRTTKRGVYVSDYTRWISSDETIATIDKNGVVTTYKEGEFTVTAETYQSKANPGTNASTSITLKAQASMVSAAQKSATKAEIVFDTNMKDVITKDNLVVSSIVGTTPVKQIVKSVSFDETGKIATVEVYVAFATNTEYTFEYNNLKAGFVGADLSIDKVASIAITTQTAKVNEATKVNVTLYDANGIEIANDGSRVTLSTDSNDCFLYGDEITFFESGKSALVKAVFHTYKYSDTGVETTIETAGTIVSVTAASGIQTVTDYHVGKSAPSIPWNASNLSQRLSTSDTSGYYIFVKAVDVNGTTLYSTTDDTDKFTFESSDSATLIVGQQGDIYPVRAGSVNIIVKYDGVVVAAVPVTIIGDRVTATLDVALSKNTLSSGAGSNDSIVVTVTAKDQLGASTVTADNVSIEALGNNPGPNPAQTGNGKFQFTNDLFAGVDRATTYQYKVTVGNLSKVFSFVVNAPSDTVGTSQIVLSTNSVDLAFDMSKDTTQKQYDFTVEFGVAVYATNGYKMYDVDPQFIKADAAEAKAAAEADPDNTYYYFSTTNLNNAVATGAAIQLYKEATSGSAITKASAGTVRVTLFSATSDNGAAAVTKALNNTLLTVKDSQSGPSVTVKTNKLSGPVASGDAISTDVFDVKLGTNTVYDVVIGEVVGASTNRPYIKNLTYTIDVLVDGVIYTYTYSIPVNQSFIIE